jgi:hypothetical protein
LSLGWKIRPVNDDLGLAWRKVEALQVEMQRAVHGCFAGNVNVSRSNKAKREKMEL